MSEPIKHITPANAPLIDRKMDVADAFRVIAGGCLAQMQGNVQGVLDREADAEYLHQLRVGMRRLRSALSAFSHHFGKAAFAGIVPELRWLGGELGPARNWDVFVADTLPAMVDACNQYPECGTQVSFVGLRGTSRLLRQQCTDRAVAALSSDRYQNWLLKFEANLAQDAWPQGKRLPVGKFAQQILHQREQDFTHGGKDFRKLAPEALHALRISGKKLRYAAEFFLPLYSLEAAHAFLKTLSVLQDVLGAINDAKVTLSLLDEMPDADPQAVCVAKAWLARETAQHIAKLDPAWTQFKAARPFWQ